MSEDTASGRLAHLPPLGVAAKRIEDGATAFVDALFDARFGLRRRHWQLLRWAGWTTDPTVDAFVEAAALFYTDAEARQVVDDLLDRGWIRTSGGVLALTDDGSSGFEAMREAQEETWDVVLDGLTEQEYAATVTAMTRIADNLERGVRERGPR